MNGPAASRDTLRHLLNEDLAREYQGIIAYVTYSQVLTGAAFMAIAQEQEHAIDLVTAMGVEVPRPSRRSSQVMAAGPSGGGFFATHPATGDRIDRLRQAVG